MPRVILYVETNFLLSIAKGQDPQADTLLQNLPSWVRLVIPSICYIEALSTWKDEQKYSQRFVDQLKLKLNEARRDRTSSNAASLVAYIERILSTNEELLNDIQRRLSQAIDQLLTQAEMIELTIDILQEISSSTLVRPNTALIENDPIDNLILNCVIAHARLHPTEVKVFLSSNTRDFGKATVQEALRNANVDNYFSRTQAFLGWFQSRSAE